VTVRRREKDQWNKIKIMLNPVDTKQAWLGIEVDVQEDKVLTKQQLIKKGQGEKDDIFVLGYASSWSSSDKSDKPAAKKARTTEPDKDASGSAAGNSDPSNLSSSFAQVAWNFMEGLELFFYGTVAIEGSGNSVPLVAERHEGQGPFLSWQVFGKGWDTLMASEMPCLAFVVPAVKKGKSGKGDKMKTHQFLKEQGSSEPSGKSKSAEGKDIAEQAVMGKAAVKRKAKRKATTKESKNEQKLSDAITFVEAPLFLGFSCGGLAFYAYKFLNHFVCQIVHGGTGK